MTNDNKASRSVCVDSFVCYLGWIDCAGRMADQHEEQQGMSDTNGLC